MKHFITDFIENLCLWQIRSKLDGKFWYYVLKHCIHVFAEDSEPKSAPYVFQPEPLYQILMILFRFKIFYWSKTKIQN